MTSLWASGSVEWLSERYKFVIYVDASRGTGATLLQTIAQQSVDARSYVISEDDVFNLIKLYQRRTLLLIDGYEHIGKLDDDVIDVLRRAMFREACVVMTSLSSHVTRHATRMFDARFLLTGLQTCAVQRFVTHYAHVMCAPEVALTSLTDQLAAAETNVTQLFAVNPMLCMKMALVAQHEQSLQANTYYGKRVWSQFV